MNVRLGRSLGEAWEACELPVSSGETEAHREAGTWPGFYSESRAELELQPLLYTIRNIIFLCFAPCIWVGWSDILTKKEGRVRSV